MLSLGHRGWVRGGCHEETCISATDAGDAADRLLDTVMLQLRLSAVRLRHLCFTCPTASLCSELNSEGVSSTLHSLESPGSISSLDPISRAQCV